MAAGNTLGEYFVELSVRGAEAVKAALAAVGDRLKDVNAIGDHLGKTFTAAFGAATTSVLALATAGTAGTMEGAQMLFVWQQLARELAAVALPALRAVTGVIERLTDWLRSLSAAQQDQLLFWGSLAVGITLVVSSLAPLTGVFVAVIGAIAATADTLDEFIAKLKVAVGVVALIYAAVGVARMIGGDIYGGLKNLAQGAALGVAVGVASAAPAGSGGRRSELTPVGGSFGPIAGSYARIQQGLFQYTAVRVEDEKLRTTIDRHFSQLPEKTGVEVGKRVNTGADY